MSEKTNPNERAKNLTIREYFAGVALQGIVTHPGMTPLRAAQEAVTAADLLIHALNGKLKEENLDCF